mgnify:FL=1
MGNKRIAYSEFPDLNEILSEENINHIEILKETEKEIIKMGNKTMKELLQMFGLEKEGIYNICKFNESYSIKIFRRDFNIGAAYSSYMGVIVERVGITDLDPMNLEIYKFFKKKSEKKFIEPYTKKTLGEILLEQIKEKGMN